MRICNLSSPDYSSMYMRIAFTDTDYGAVQFQEWLSKYGDYEVVTHCDENCDFIICWGITQQEKAWRALEKCPNTLIINYNWDCYEWSMQRRRGNLEYDFVKYGELLKKSIDIWVPSHAIGKRQKEWWNLDYHVIKSHSPMYDIPTSDERFVLNAQRDNPDDRRGWFERACEELKIPYRSTKHELEREEFRKVLASCSFQVSPYYEMSTGGLMILEGYYLGKPVLLSNSPYQGGGEYLGDRAEYFQHDDFEDLKRKIKDMWENPCTVASDHKEWMRENYSEDRIAKDIHNRLQYLYERKNT